MSVFGKESVSGMNRIDIADFADADDAFDQEVTGSGGRCADADGLIRETDRQAVFVGLGIGDHGFDPHFLAGADDAECNFSAVGYQNFIKHSDSEVGSGAYSRTKSG
ncbi:hypothetical protein SDC9_176526 [bioreactor metagenome]|uniref:Uncharacterized protein n=1 Tax=bioreactor metagenome TaxID=1076179 RepID=A0A645GQB1_9ZZZZ